MQINVWETLQGLLCTEMFIQENDSIQSFPLVIKTLNAALKWDDFLLNCNQTNICTHAYKDREDPFRWFPLCHWCFHYCWYAEPQIRSHARHIVDHPMLCKCTRVSPRWRTWLSHALCIPLAAISTFRYTEDSLLNYFTVIGGFFLHWHYRSRQAMFKNPFTFQSFFSTSV